MFGLCELKSKNPGVDFINHPKSYRHYLASRPKKWENDAINLMIGLSAKHDCPIHIVHVSSAEALESIERAKQKGLKVTAETCAQYLYFNAEEIPDGQTIYKCAPPIREKANNELLKKALKNGLLDFIATDHSPAPPSLKEIESGNLMKAWGGIAGIQYLLPASWTALKELMSLEEFIPLLTSRPASFIQSDHKKGKIAVGYDADLVCWNPDKKFTATIDSVQFRHKISPYVNKEFFGEIEQTIVNGDTVFLKNEFIHFKKGKWLRHQ
ncbi:MAG: amidohydrolase family protein [Ferruginibacter sp.]|nr:amidohydrolase family protein [Ferruginibacter sp.]